MDAAGVEKVSIAMIKKYDETCASLSDISDPLQNRSEKGTDRKWPWRAAEAGRGGGHGGSGGSGGSGGDCGSDGGSGDSGANGGGFCAALASTSAKVLKNDRARRWKPEARRVRRGQH